MLRSAPSGVVVAYLVLCLGTVVSGVAQTVDLNRVVPPLEAIPKTLADYLVQQAWANAPTRRILEATIVGGEQRVGLARRSWMDQVGFNFNLATQRQTYEAFNQLFLAPGGNFGTSFNLGGFTNNKAKTQIAQTETLLARAKLDEQLPAVREEVMLTLQTIDVARELLRIRRRAEVDAETNNDLVKSLYDQGKAQFQDVAQASEVYYQAVAGTVVAKSNLEVAQIQLRTITGLTQEQIEQARRRYAVK